MSEFKYSCPVCGQHMKCDTAQAGSVMDCPTCFQKIVVPMPPMSADSKLIMTGTKFTGVVSPAAPIHPSMVGKMPPAKAPVAEDAHESEPKKFPLAIVVVVVLVLAAGAAVFLLRGKIFKSSAGAAPAVTNAAPAAASEPTAEPAAPASVAPVASDANWTNDLAAAVTPDAPAAGRIHGRDFLSERAFYQSGVLTLRQGAKGPMEFGMQINFNGAAPEALAGQTINVTSDTEKAANVSLRWKDDSGVQKQNFANGYALRLEFSALVKGRLPGKIYLCTPDAEKSYVMGSFNAAILKPKPKPAPKK
jgi:DNA-directed RNA polymerase subunit RPC12/RpoP